MGQKTAGSSQAAWALLAEGVTSARLESHRVRAMLSRVLKIVDASQHKEHIYQVAGDLIVAAPKHVEELERHLDRTSYALSVLGEDSLRESLPLHDRKIVDDAVERSKPLFGQQTACRRVARRYMADLTPALGFPGGPCHVIERIRDEVQNPRVQQPLVDSVEEGRDLSNPEAAKVYDLDVEHGPSNSKIKRIILMSHAQYRMDQRGIYVPVLRAAIGNFWQTYSKEKSLNTPHAKRWKEDMARHEPINWTDPKLHLTVVFVVDGTDARVVTTYWEGEPNPRPPGDGGCDT